MDIKQIRKQNLLLLIKESGGRKLFGEKTGKSEAQISQLLSNSKTSRNIGDRLARDFERSCAKPAGWMDTVHGNGQRTASAEFTYMPAVKQNAPREDELEFIGHMDAWDSDTPLGPDEVELPLFREVELAAGGGRTEVIENHGAKLRFARSTLSRAGVDPANAACATVKGNSMERLIPDGTTVGVNTGDKEIRDGEIYAFDHDGMLRVKYLQRKPGGGIRVISENIHEHPPEDYDADEVAENIRLIGRVFWWSVLR